MRSLSLVLICGLQLTVAACDSSSTDNGSGGEIRSQEDVRQLFQDRHA